MRHVLITGGQGYIGNYLTKSFLEDGWTVSTLDSCYNDNKELDFSGYSQQLKRYRASVANHDIVGRAMKGVDVVYHLAARSDWSNHPRQAMKLTHVNTYGTATVLSMARQAGVNKVIFTSSAEVYGNLVPAEETDPCVPITMYGATMLSAEAICRGFYELGMEVVILRLAEVWGGKLSNSLVNEFANGCRKVYGDLDQTRDYIHISDVIKALRKAIEWDSAIYNIGTGEEITLDGVWSKLHPDKQLICKNSRYTEVFRNCLNMEYTQQKTGWKPEVSLADLNREEIIKHCEAI